MNSQDHDQTPSDPSDNTPPAAATPKPRRSRSSAVATAAAAAVTAAAAETAAAVALPASLDAAGLDAAMPEADVAAKPKRTRRKVADAGVAEGQADASTPELAAPAALVVDVVADAVATPAATPAADGEPAKAAKPRRRAAAAVAAEATTPDAAAAPLAATPVVPSQPVEAQAATSTAQGAEHRASTGAETGSAGPDAAAGTADNRSEGASEGAAEATADGDDTRRRKRNRRRGRRSGADRAARDGDTAVDAVAGARAVAATGGDDDEDDDEPGDAPVVAMPRAAPLDSADTFAAVLSGDYDAEPTDAATSAEPERRVLAAEPDAPKLHKVLAQAGIGSRRDMEELIAEGQVMVNNQPAHTGQRISFGDRIVVAGKLIKVRIAPPPPRIIAYHKPVGEIVTNDDPQNRPTVYRRLPRLSHGKWQSVGRLDINTEGLLLFTNSGELANQLMHPRFGVEREYAVRVLGTLENDARARLIDGVEIDGQRAGFKSIEDGGGEGVNRWYRVVITEGRNREVRKLFDKVGLGVSRLIRIRYGCVVLPRGLRRGLFVDLNEAEVREVRRLAAGGRDPAGVGQPAPARPPREPSAQAANGGAPRDGQSRDGQARDGQARDGQARDSQGAGRGNNNNRRNGPAPQRAERDRPPRPDRPDRPERQGGQGGQGNNADRPPNRQAERRERLPRLDGDGEVDHVNFAAIPNPLMQTFDKRAIREARAPRREIAEDGPIPNPLEQTYDKRFVQKPRAFGAGGGGGRKDGGGAGGQPDPMKTSMGYIGADAFVRKFQGNGGAGGGGGGGHGGGGGGRRGGGGGGGNSGGGGGGGGRRGGGGGGR